MYEVFDERAVKLLLALDTGDTIAAAARKIDENRETVRRLVDRLEDAGFVTYDDGLALVDDEFREPALEYLAAAATMAPPSIGEAYVLPQFAGRTYAFTAIDAIYLWTRGGYQVARDPEDYPIFIAVEESEVGGWEAFFERFGLPTARQRQPADTVDGPVQVVLDPGDGIEATTIDGDPVVPLSEAVTFAREHYATFEPALEMLDNMYDAVDIDASHHHPEPA